MKKEPLSHDRSDEPREIPRSTPLGMESPETFVERALTSRRRARETFGYIASSVLLETLETKLANAKSRLA
jgi:hypothetical protein